MNVENHGGNDLESCFPKIAKEWHPTKNGNIKPSMISKGSAKEYWWIDDLGHEWKASCHSRTQGTGCPYCSGSRVLIGYNDLGTICPQLAIEWHPTKNGDVTPQNITASSGKKVWWLGTCGHEWEAPPYSRRIGNGCPYCAGKKVLIGFNDLRTISPFLSSEWHQEKNGNLQPTDVTACSGKKVWWFGHCGHEWQATIAHRFGRGDNCPICAKEVHTSFPEQVVYYYIKQIFHDAVLSDHSMGFELDIYCPSINTAIEYDGSHWHQDSMRDIKKSRLCNEKNILLYRIRELGCPPLADEYDKNSIYCRKDNVEDLTSAIRVLFNRINIVCDINIERDRAKIYSCFINLVKENSLQESDPKISASWHPYKNGSLAPNMVSRQSHRKVWWQCEKGHEWQTTVANRLKAGCPYCAGKKVINGFNDLETLNVAVALEWHPLKNDPLLPSNVLPNSHKKVWWLGKCGHEWEASIANRNRGKGCPICSGRLIIPGINDLKTLNPILAAEWHPAKNGELLPSAIPLNYNKTVWWMCKYGHEWQVSPNQRVNKHTGCPKCIKHKY